MVTEPTTDGRELLEGLLGVAEVIETKTAERYKQYMYWKTCNGCPVHPDQKGWVVIAPAMSETTMQEYYTHLNHKHFTPLPQYGAYTPTRNAKQRWSIREPEQRFNYIVELGGIKEFPIDQIIAYGWHRNPTMQKYFPQLKEVPDLVCEYCPHRHFSDPAHLAIHTKAMHNDVAQTKAMGAEMAKVIERVAGLSTNNSSPDQIAAIVAAVMQAMKDSN